jgi:sarcosine oxidase
MDPRIIAVAACSGHGFKFGPVIGEDVADLVAPR